jgi:ArsR family transcriptional regulator, virulence genes transcriptional regulator
MVDVKTLQKKLFSHSDELREGSEIFDILGNECRLEMVLALMEVGELSSGDIAQVTNCTPSAVSQALAMMKRTRMVEARREWLNIYYSLNYENALVKKLMPIFKDLLKS